MKSIVFEGLVDLADGEENATCGIYEVEEWSRKRGRCGGREG
jgi:hypothetical protein